MILSGIHVKRERYGSCSVRYKIMKSTGNRVQSTVVHIPWAKSVVVDRYILFSQGVLSSVSALLGPTGARQDHTVVTSAVELRWNLTKERSWAHLKPQTGPAYSVHLPHSRDDQHKEWGGWSEKASERILADIEFTGFRTLQAYRQGSARLSIVPDHCRVDWISLRRLPGNHVSDGAE